MKKRIALLLAFALTVSALAGCGQKEAAESTSAATEESTEEVAPAEEAAGEEYLKLNWDYINSTKSGFQSTAKLGNYMETQLIWSTLVRMDVETGEVIYDLADSIDISEDGLTYTVTLKDAVWHDGEPVTAEDVVFTYNALIFGPTKMLAQYMASVKGYDAAVNGEADSIEGIYAVDDKTVVFELSEVNYLLLSMGQVNIFANGGFSILPAHILGDVEWDKLEEHEYWQCPIGTGPYKIAEVSYPNYCVLERNEDYHREPAGIEKVLLTSYTDAEAQLAAMMAGDLHYMRGVALTSAENVTAQNADCEYFIHEGGLVRWLMFGTNQSVAQNKDFMKQEVRQALNLIIDKQAIVDYLGTASVATTMNNDAEYNTDIPKWERDVEKGVQMLEDAGFDFTKTVKILMYYSDQASVDIMDIMVANLAEAGITAEYTIDEKTSNDQWATGAFDMYYGATGYNAEVYYQFGKDGIRESSFGGYDAEHRQQYNDLWNEYVNTADANGRKLVAGEMQVLYMEDMYAMPCYFVNSVYLVNTSVFQNFTGMGDYERTGDYQIANWSLGN